MGILTSFLRQGMPMPQQAPQEKSAGGFLSNVAGGAEELITGLGGLVGTLAKDAGTLLTNPISGDFATDDIIKQLPSALAEDYKRRYTGGIDNILEGLYQEPLAYAGDLLDVATLGGTAYATKTGKLGRAVGSYFNEVDVTEADAVLDDIASMPEDMGVGEPFDIDQRAAEIEALSAQMRETFDPYRAQPEWTELRDRKDQLEMDLGEIAPDHPLARYRTPPPGWAPSTPGGFWEDGREIYSMSGPDVDDGDEMIMGTANPRRDIAESLEDLQERDFVGRVGREPTEADAAAYNDAIRSAYLDGFTHADAAVEVGFERAFGTPESLAEAEGHFRGFMQVFGNGHGHLADNGEIIPQGGMEEFEELAPFDPGPGPDPESDLQFDHLAREQDSFEGITQGMDVPEFPEQNPFEVPENPMDRWFVNPMRQRLGRDPTPDEIELFEYYMENMVDPSKGGPAMLEEGLRYVDEELNPDPYAGIPLPSRAMGENLESAINEQGDDLNYAGVGGEHPVISEFHERIQAEGDALDPATSQALQEFVFGLQTILPPEILDELGHFNLTLQEWQEMAVRAFDYRDSGAPAQEAVTNAVVDWFDLVDQRRGQLDLANPRDIMDRGSIPGMGAFDPEVGYLPQMGEGIPTEPLVADQRLADASQSYTRNPQSPMERYLGTEADSGMSQFGAVGLGDISSIYPFREWDAVSGDLGPDPMGGGADAGQHFQQTQRNRQRSGGGGDGEGGGFGDSGGYDPGVENERIRARNRGVRVMNDATEAQRQIDELLAKNDRIGLSDEEQMALEDLEEWRIGAIQFLRENGYEAEVNALEESAFAPLRSDAPAPDPTHTLTPLGQRNPQFQGLPSGDVIRMWSRYADQVHPGGSINNDDYARMVVLEAELLARGFVPDPDNPTRMRRAMDPDEGIEYREYLENEYADLEISGYSVGGTSRFREVLPENYEELRSDARYPRTQPHSFEDQDRLDQAREEFESGAYELAQGEGYDPENPQHNRFSPQRPDTVQVPGGGAARDAEGQLQYYSVHPHQMMEFPPLDNYQRRMHWAREALEGHQQRVEEYMEKLQDPSLQDWEISDYESELAYELRQVEIARAELQEMVQGYEELGSGEFEEVPIPEEWDTAMRWDWQHQDQARRRPMLDGEYEWSENSVRDYDATTPRTDYYHQTTPLGLNTADREQMGSVPLRGEPPNPEDFSGILEYLKWVEEQGGQVTPELLMMLLGGTAAAGGAYAYANQK